MPEVSVIVHVREWLAKTTVPPLRSFSLPPELESTLPKVGEEFSVDASFMGEIRRSQLVRLKVKSVERPSPAQAVLNCEIWPATSNQARPSLC
jgi:hypothetical protein